VSRNWPELRLQKLAKDIEAITVLIGFIVQIILVSAEVVDVMAIGTFGLDRAALPSTAGRLDCRLINIPIWEVPLDVAGIIQQQAFPLVRMQAPGAAQYLLQQCCAFSVAKQGNCAGVLDIEARC